MIGIYQFNIKNYGIYVSQSYDVDQSIQLQLEVLKSNKHHCYPLQLLYNLYYEDFSVEKVQQLSSVDEFLTVGYAYRSLYDFTLDSVFRSSVIDTHISRRYCVHNKLLYLQVDPDTICHIYTSDGKKIGIEVAKRGTLSGHYKIVRKNMIRRVYAG